MVGHARRIRLRGGSWRCGVFARQDGWALCSLKYWGKGQAERMKDEIGKFGPKLAENPNMIRANPTYSDLLRPNPAKAEKI